LRERAVTSARDAEVRLVEQVLAGDELGSS
jgi:hypothetical protein